MHGITPHCCRRSLKMYQRNMAPMITMDTIVFFFGMICLQCVAGRNSVLIAFLMHHQYEQYIAQYWVTNKLSQNLLGSLFVDSCTNRAVLLEMCELLPFHEVSVTSCWIILSSVFKFLICMSFMTFVFIGEHLILDVNFLLLHYSTHSHWHLVTRSLLEKGI